MSYAASSVISNEILTSKYAYATVLIVSTSAVAQDLYLRRFITNVTQLVTITSRNRLVIMRVISLGVMAITLPKKFGIKFGLTLK